MDNILCPLMHPNLPRDRYRIRERRSGSFSGHHDLLAIDDDHDGIFTSRQRRGRRPPVLTFPSTMSQGLGLEGHCRFRSQNQTLARGLEPVSVQMVRRYLAGIQGWHYPNFNLGLIDRCPPPS